MFDKLESLTHSELESFETNSFGVLMKFESFKPEPGWQVLLLIGDQPLSATTDLETKQFWLTEARSGVPGVIFKLDLRLCYILLCLEVETEWSSLT